MFKKMASIAMATLDVTLAVICSDEEESEKSSLPQHVSLDDHVSYETYTDGAGNEYRRDFSGEIRNPFGLTPED
jgi:hypothetical protein